MKRAVVTVLVMSALLPVTAFAGKRERDYMKNEVAPAVKDAEAKFKGACGCALKITIKEDTYKAVGDMSAPKSLVEHIAEGAQQYCTDAESKQAVCRMRSLDVAWANDVVFTFKAGKGNATTNGLSTPSWDMITAELDK